MKIKVQIVLLFLYMSLILPNRAMAFNTDKWDAILKQHVHRTQLYGIPLQAVAYPKIINDIRFPQLLQQLDEFNPATLKSEEEKLAFWINTYNIFAIKMIIDNYPLKSIKDVGSIFKPVWNKDIGKVGGKSYSLDHIENEILRKFNQPLIHAAIVCASVSCPDLRNHSYKAENLYTQLEDQMTGFLHNKAKGLRIDKNKKILYLSSIFNWFEKDFKDYGGPIVFIQKFLDNKEKTYISNTKLKIKYLNYNWKLNE